MMHKPAPKQTINNVVIVGGTHGNEITGVYAVKHWMEHPNELLSLKGNSFKLEVMLANEKAIAENRRYIDRDLNRCFKFADLDNSDLMLYEECRAKKINQLIGYRSPQQADFVIDLHTTTSNMGSSLIISTLNPLIFNLAAFLNEKIPDLKVYYEALSPEDNPYLYSLGRTDGILIEIGPTPQGVLRADIYQKMVTMVKETLAYMNLFNNKQLPPLPRQLVAYEPARKIAFPVDSHGQLQGMIHESLQDQDFKPLKNGAPLFRLLDGTELFFEIPDNSTETTYYPAFTNEAAYYVHQQALQLLKKIELEL